MKDYVKYEFWAMACHLSYFLGFLIPFPFGSILFPLIIWGVKKDDSELVRENGKSILNFALSMWVYGVLFCLIIIGLGIPLFRSMNFSFKEIEQNIRSSAFNFRDLAPSFIDSLIENLGPSILIFIPFILLILFFSIIEIILVIYGSIKALNGEVYYYPFTLKFLNYISPSNNHIPDLQQKRKGENT